MPPTPKLRVFAGPNGSGKSIMKRQVEQTVVNGRRVDLGIYVNADEIAKTLRESSELDLSEYQVVVDRSMLKSFAVQSGLLNASFTIQQFQKDHAITGTVFRLWKKDRVEHHAQLLAAFLCNALLQQGTKFSFETVFSHKSKVEFMERARKSGYKVYLYFIATNAPEINVDRVRIRVKAGGHHVPQKKITERYHRSLEHILPAIEECYHAFIFDNSATFLADGGEPKMFAEMKRSDVGKQWWWSVKNLPDWFIRAYLNASGDPIYRDVANRALGSREPGS